MVLGSWSATSTWQFLIRNDNRLLKYIDGTRHVAAFSFFVMRVACLTIINAFSILYFKHLCAKFLLLMYRFSAFCLTTLLCFCLAAPMYAQSRDSLKAGQPRQQPQMGKVSGKLTDAQGKALPYATVTVLRSNASVVNGDLTREDGSFSISPVGTGTFSLRISALGYDTKTVDGISLTSDAPDKNLGTIRMAAAQQQLKEVEVTGERPVMEISAEKKTFNVEKNITTAGGSASDVLQNVPSVSVDADGGVSLRGKGNVTILIDGKPATMLGGDNASALQSLPASSIQSVEVITNPSAKYDAQGMTGIINIITKKDRKLGFNGTATVGAGTRDKYNGSLNLNLRSGKWNTFLNSSYRYNPNYNRTTNERSNAFNDTTYRSYEDNKRAFGGFFNTVGAEYAPDERNSFTLTENINWMEFSNEGRTDYRVHSAPGVLAGMQQRYNKTRGGPFSISSSLDYKHKFRKPKQELSTNVTFVKGWMTREMDYTTSYYDANEQLTDGPVFQTAPGSGSSATLNAQADYSMPAFTKTGKLDAGVKSQTSWFESSNNPIVDTPGVGPRTDFSLLNSYNYNQQTQAAYVSYGDQSGPWSFSGGLRLEYFKYSGTTNALNGADFSSDFLNLFPSLFVSRQLGQQQSMYLSVTRRTNRPDFRQMMPYLDLSNPQDTGSGNPDLVPEFIYNTELNYSRQFGKGHSVMAGAYYQYTQNLIERYRRFYNDGTSFTQPRNLNSGATYGLELTGRAQIMPIWDATLNFNFFQNVISGKNIDPTVDNSGFSWLGKVNTNLRLPKGFFLQVNGNYEAPKPAAQGHIQEVGWVDAAIRKNLWNNKATVVFNVSDIFNTRKYTTDYDLGSSFQSIYRDRETRIGTLTFTYRFGKSDLKNDNRKGRQNGQQQPGKDRDNIKQGDDSSGF